MAVTKADYRKIIKKSFDDTAGYEKYEYKEDVGIQLWIKNNFERKFAIGIQLDKFRLGDDGASRVSIRFYSSKSSDVLEWDKFDAYMPKRTFTEQVKSFFSAQGDWMSFNDKDELKSIINMQLPEALRAFKKFVNKSNSL